MSLKLAIVGGGPSAFYVASRVLSMLADKPAVAVHVYDRLWAPHGLVRYGVAPDHPEVKNCTHKFDQTAADPRFRFFGNVNVAPAPYPCGIPHVLHLSLAALQRHYTHVLLASGCPHPVAHPALPPSPTCRSALSVVHWYTHHPSLTPPPPLATASRVTIVGHGNVALDIARILLSPLDALALHDVPAPVLAVLADSAVRHVSIVGRRGPSQVRFSAKELREMMHLPDVAMVPIPPSLFPATGDGVQLPRAQTRVLGLLRTGSALAPSAAQRTFSIDFHRSPAAYDASTNALTLEETRIDADGVAVSTGTRNSSRTDLVLTSLGYAGDALSVPFAWFDTRASHLRVSGGRVPAAGEDARVYASGWAAGGARGVLGATLVDATDVARTIVQDALAEPAPNAEDGVPAEIAQSEAVFDYAAWKRVDAEEQRRGRALGKERERMGYHEALKFREYGGARQPQHVVT